MTPSAALDTITHETTRMLGVLDDARKRSVPAVLLEHDGEEVAKGRLVVDDEDVHRGRLYGGVAAENVAEVMKAALVEVLVRVSKSGTRYFRRASSVGMYAENFQAAARALGRELGTARAPDEPAPLTFCAQPIL